MTIRGDSKKPKALLQTEHLTGPSITLKKEPGSRPGLLALTTFSSPSLPDPSLAQQARSLLQLNSSETPSRVTPHLSFFAPTLTALLIRIRQTLEAQPTRLLELNPSRRESICNYLESLAGSSPAPRTPAMTQLRSWIDWRNLSTPHQKAFLTFLEEVALFSRSGDPSESVVRPKHSKMETRRPLRPQCELAWGLAPVNPP